MANKAQNSQLNSDAIGLKPYFDTTEGIIVECSKNQAKAGRKSNGYKL